MGQRYNVRRVTWVDVLVGAGLCLFVLLIVPPLFSRTREQHARICCQANLAQIGATMLVYADDYDGALPRAGGPSSGWGAPIDWMAPDHDTAFEVGQPDTPSGMATISSSFYLLVKYMETSPNLFVCKGDVGTSPWQLSDEPDGPPGFQPTDAWDFGSQPTVHCSYAYHFPFGPYVLTTARDPNLAVIADRNPWIESPGAPPEDAGCFMPDVPPYDGTVRQARRGNSPCHQKDGQNVFFLDGRVSFATRAYCAVDDDNIYTVSSSWTTGDPLGMVPYERSLASNRSDSLLVHDPNEAFVPPKPRL